MFSCQGQQGAQNQESGGWKSFTLARLVDSHNSFPFLSAPISIRRIGIEPVDVVEKQLFDCWEVTAWSWNVTDMNYRKKTWAFVATLFIHCVSLHANILLQNERKRMTWAALEGFLDEVDHCTRMDSTCSGSEQYITEQWGRDMSRILPVPLLCSSFLAKGARTCHIYTDRRTVCNMHKSLVSWLVNMWTTNYRRPYFLCALRRTGLSTLTESSHQSWPAL